MSAYQYAVLEGSMHTFYLADDVSLCIFGFARVSYPILTTWDKYPSLFAQTPKLAKPVHVLLVHQAQTLEHVY